MAVKGKSRTRQARYDVLKARNRKRLGTIVPAGAKDISKFKPSLNQVSSNARARQRALARGRTQAKAKPYDRQRYDGHQDQEAGDDN